MKIYLDGQYFAEGDDLETIAELAKVPENRLSFDLVELKERKKASLERDAIANIKAIAKTMSEDYALELILLIATDAAVRQRMSSILAQLKQLKLNADKASTETELEAVNWRTM